MLLHNADKDVCAWVGEKIFGDPESFDEKCRAIGVLHRGNLIAGVVYSNYHPGRSIEMSVASIDKRWCNRHNLRAFFKYPFIDLGVKRVQTLCSANNKGVIMFNKRLGFKQEGRHPEAWPLGGEAISWGMLAPDCEWIKGA